mmetsp:Transcript_130851/g.194968  ORF Transcript_130851/g.194968 Transcript_130851/m.194968 type:complete len:145 (+) Transcript_130851:1-435(+)
MASVLAVAAITMLIVLAAQLGGSPRSQRTALEVRNKNAAKMTLLCEGHFLDTATGIPETSYSTLSHPDELEGYKEPLPEDIRAQIDAKYYDNLGPEYQFAGCLDDGKVNEVKTAVGESKNEHFKLAHYASGHDETWYHPPLVNK